MSKIKMGCRHAGVLGRHNNARDPIMGISSMTGPIKKTERRKFAAFVTQQMRMEGMVKCEMRQHDKPKAAKKLSASMSKEAKRAAVARHNVAHDRIRPKQAQWLRKQSPWMR